MSSIQEIIVVEPPTSAEVQERVVQAMLSGSFVSLVVRLIQEIPVPQDEEVSFRIQQTVHPLEGGMTIAGMTEDARSIIIRTPSEISEPARGQMVIAN